MGEVSTFEIELHLSINYSQLFSLGLSSPQSLEPNTLPSRLKDMYCKRKRATGGGFQMSLLRELSVSMSSNSKALISVSFLLMPH